MQSSKSSKKIPRKLKVPSVRGRRNVRERVRVKSKRKKSSNH
jgi:hypothetical protein